MMFRITSLAAVAMAAGLSLTPAALAQQQTRDEDGYYQPPREQQEQRQRQQQRTQQPARTQQDNWPGRQDEFPGRGNAYGARNRFDEEYGRYSGNDSDMQDQSWRMQQRPYDNDPAHQHTRTTGDWRDQDRWQETDSQQRFGTQSDQRMRTQQQFSQSMQQTSRMSGTVQSTQVTTVQGQQHLVVSLDTDRGMQRIDLGPVEEVRQYRTYIREGRPLVVSAGPSSGGLVTANMIEIDGRSVPLTSTTYRTYPSSGGMSGDMLDGRIQQVAIRTLEGDEHLTVLLDSDRGPNWIDLGPVTSQQQLLSALLRGDTLQINAAPAPAGQYFVARTINVEGQTIPVTSTTTTYQSTMSSQNYGTSEPTYSSSTTTYQSGDSLNGTVRTVEVRNLNGDEHVVVLLNTDRGANWVDLGPVSVIREYRNLIREGETLTVSASPAPGGEQYFVARNLTVQGREIPIQTTSTFQTRTFESSSASQMQSGSTLSGNVQDVQVRTIDGDRHIVALVNTDRGANWIDLGSEESAQQFRDQIREGSTITVQASPASGGQYFVASNLNLSGRSFPIQTSGTTMRSSQQTFGTTDQNFDSQQRQQDWRQQQGRTQQSQQEWQSQQQPSQQEWRQQSTQDSRQSQQDWRIQQNQNQQQDWRQQQMQRDQRQSQADWRNQQSQNQQDWRQQQNQNWQQQNWYQNQSGQSQTFDRDRTGNTYYQDPQQRTQSQQGRNFYQNDQYQRDQQYRQNDYNSQQPPYGRAQGYRENRGMDPLYGEPGRRTGQQTGASDTTRRDQDQRMEDQRRLEEQRRREDERRRERDSDER